MTDIPASTRKRVERLLSERFTVEDLPHIFLFLRDASYGRETVREIGDFVAHYAKRDKGATTERARKFF